jgi:predicted Rossmann-fold nucleotide-binding protein
LWERLSILIGRADAFIILPGATGTLAEIGVAWEFLCKRLMPPKPLVFVGPHWRPLFDLMMAQQDTATRSGEMVAMVNNAKEAVDFVGKFCGK